jgi:hypothetical protein
LEELEGRISELQADLTERCIWNIDGRAEPRVVESRAGLVDEVEAEDVVVEANRSIKILDRDPDVVQSVHDSS